MRSPRHPFHLPMLLAVLVVLVPACTKEVPWQPRQALVKDEIKIGAIFPSRITPESSYDYMHYLGIMKMQNAVQLREAQIIYKADVFEGRPNEAETAMRDCIAEGANIILALSWGYGSVCEKLAVEFPGVIFAHATGTTHNAVNLTNYSARTYEARYLSGIAAGLRTETGKIGYVAAMGKDNSEVTGGINAFALGVEEVNPGARIHVKVTYSWFDPMGETDAANALIAAGCDVIAQHCNTARPMIAAEKAGVWGIGYNSDMALDAPGAVLTSVVFDWGVYYTHLVQSVIAGSFSTAPYLSGLDTGMVGLSPFNEALIAPRTVYGVETRRRLIASGVFNIFSGLMETNDGKIVGREGAALSDSEITGAMNWYYRTIIEEK